MRVLIIHGWMHSAKIYERLKNELENKINCKVDIYELAGFGNKPADVYDNIIYNYKNNLKEHLTNNYYDYIIGHSLGGNIILRTINEINIKSHIILLSPEYYGVFLLKVVKPLLIIAPYIFKWLKNVNPFTTFFIKVFSLFTINSWKAINSDIVWSARQADPIVAAILLREMANDNFVTKKQSNIDLIIGEKDRMISRKKMHKLRDDIEDCKMKIINHIGHTAVLEDFDELLNTLIKIME